MIQFENLDIWWFIAYKAEFKIKIFPNFQNNFSSNLLVYNELRKTLKKLKKKVFKNLQTHIIESNFASQ